MSLKPLTFPAAAAECRLGDHLVREEADGVCRVYRVRDIVALERLVPGATRPVGLVAEADLLDSMAPAYAGQVYLLLDIMEPPFATADEAVRAARAGRLSAGVEGLLKPAADFPAERTRVISGLAATEG